MAAIKRHRFDHRQGGIDQNSSSSACGDVASAIFGPGIGSAATGAGKGEAAGHACTPTVAARCGSSGCFRYLVAGDADVVRGGEANWKVEGSHRFRHGDKGDRRDGQVVGGYGGGATSGDVAGCVFSPGVGGPGAESGDGEARGCTGTPACGGHGGRSSGFVDQVAGHTDIISGKQGTYWYRWVLTGDRQGKGANHGS